MSAETGDIKLSDGGVRIAKSNALCFTRTDNQSGTKQTLDNRQLTQMTVQNTDDNWNYFQKFKIGDIITTQIVTIYTIDSFKVYDFEDDSLIETISIPAASRSIDSAIDLDGQTTPTVNFYDIQIDTSLYGGWYYVIATINTSQLYKCEPFYVFNFTDLDGVQLKWYNSVSSFYNDGIDYTASPVNNIRLDARFFYFEPGQLKEVYTSFLGSKKTLSGQPLRFINLELGALPGWMVEKINIALQHETFMINDVIFDTEDLIGAEPVKQGEQGTYMYKSSIKLQQRDYENYEDITAATPVSGDYIKFSSDDADKAKASSNTDDTIDYK